MGTNNDPVPDGMRRVSVDVTLLADEDEALAYASDKFTLTVAGSDPARPHNDVLPGTSLPAGTSMTGTLIFDVPQDATTGSLSFDDGPGTAVTLPPESESDAPVPVEQQVPHVVGDTSSQH
jgi:hypothetical protein